VAGQQFTDETKWLVHQNCILPGISETASRTSISYAEVSWENNANRQLLVWRTPEVASEKTVSWPFISHGGHLTSLAPLRKGLEHRCQTLAHGSNLARGVNIFGSRSNTKWLLELAHRYFINVGVGFVQVLIFGPLCIFEFETPAVERHLVRSPMPEPLIKQILSRRQ